MPTYDRHVLYVDRDADARDEMLALLQTRGVDVTTAGDGKSALGVMRGGFQPDVVIANFDLPRMDGLALLKAIRARQDWIPIPFIMLNGGSDKAVYRQAMLLGVDDFIQKPFEPERLLLSIYSRAKRTQELTRYAEAAHETLSFMRRDMARMFTHELRTPLASMKMVTEILTRHGTNLHDAEAKEMIGTLQSGVLRLNRLLEQMVLLIQLDTGELQKLISDAASPGPLWDALTSAVSEARAFSHRQRDVDIFYNHGDVRGDIKAEWKSLRHALAELLSNAMAFTPKDQTILVSQWLQDNHILISITDFGPGISEKQRSDLFRRFNQLEREKHDQQGIGMGLYLAKSIIEATGGTLELRSSTDHGTTVTVKFPLHRD